MIGNFDFKPIADFFSQKKSAVAVSYVFRAYSSNADAFARHTVIRDNRTGRLIGVLDVQSIRIVFPTGLNGRSRYI